MKSLSLARSGERLSILCLGAHSDDIEIGAGGTILSLIASGVRLCVHWCVLSGGRPRAAEAEGSAEAFLKGRPRPISRLPTSTTAIFQTRAGRSSNG